MDEEKKCACGSQRNEFNAFNALCALTADQYVVGKLIEAEAKVRDAERTIDALSDECVRLRKILRMTVQCMKIKDSDWIGDYITTDYEITKERMPWLFAELKSWIDDVEMCRQDGVIMEKPE